MTENNISYLNMDYIIILMTKNFELIIITFFILLLILTVVFMLNIEKKVLIKSQEVESPERYLKLFTTIRELLETTRKDSFETLSKANEASASILKENINFSENMQDLIKKKSELVKKNYLIELKKSSERLSNQFQEEYKKEFSRSLSELKQSNSVINKKILDEAEGLIQDVHAHLNSSHDLVIKKIDQGMTETEDFLQNYKKNKIEEFDKEFKNMTNLYVRDYLKRTLSFDEHEEIIRNIMKDFEKSMK